MLCASLGPLSPGPLSLSQILVSARAPQERSFLSIEETVLTGPVGKGLAVRGAVEAAVARPQSLSEEHRVEPLSASRMMSCGCGLKKQLRRQRAFTRLLKQAATH